MVSSAQASAHKLTKLTVAEGRGFERHDVSLPCRVTFTAQHMRGLQTLFALARNLSRSGVMLVTQSPVAGIDYIAVELAPGEPAHPAVVRRARGTELGCEFMQPLTAEALMRLLHGASGK